MIGGKGFVGGFFLFVAGFFFFGSLWHIAQTNWIAATGVKANGTILYEERVASRGRRRGPCYRANFEFLDAEGVKQRGSHALCGPEGIYEPGEKIEVRYPQGRPWDAIITGFYGRFAFILVALFSLPFVYLGFRLLLADIREYKEEGW